MGAADPTAIAAPAAPRLGARNRSLVLRLLLLVAAASVFGFALVPLYDVFCKATGFNGKSDDARFRQGGLRTAAADTRSQVDTGRLVTVEFTSTVMPGLPWDVRPLDPTLEIHPGEIQTARFLVSNHSDQAIRAHAVPSVSPTQAARHFEKIDCFCFTEQTLLPGQARELAVAFVVKPALDSDVRTISLAYAFYRATPATQAAIAGNAALAPAARAATDPVTPDVKGPP
jgi:cytochrome c oxidase assembly protein subunit 11